MILGVSGLKSPRLDGKPGRGGGICKFSRVAMLLTGVK